MDNLIQQIVSELENKNKLRPPTKNPVSIGDEFVLPLTSETPICETWMVINFHVDDKNLALVVPCDNFFLAGVCDVRISDPLTPSQAPFFARCGYSCWIPVDKLPIANRVDYGFTEEAKQCRKILANLVRGNDIGTDEQKKVEADLNYQNHCDMLTELTNLIQSYIK